MNTTKVARVAFCVAALALTLSGALGGASAGAATPKLVVTPSTGLHNGEKVKVSGTGFKPGDHVYIVECLAKASGESNCNILNTIPATISKTGKLPLDDLQGHDRQDRQRNVWHQGDQPEEVRGECRQRGGR